jgi:ABC-type multidrug transport system fused ATPase/permease subunit
MVKDLISNMCPILIQVITTLFGGIIIAFVYEWRTSAVALGMLPILLLSGMLQIKIAEGFGDKNDQIYQNSSSLIA